MIISEINIENMAQTYHYPVMYRQVMDLLEISKAKVAVDCTLGLGSHACRMLKAMDDKGFLIGLDKDGDSLELASSNLKEFEGRFSLFQEDFSNLDKILDNLGLGKADVFLFDLGISSYQLSNPLRGFSFQKEGPLDMRMNRDSFLSAYDLVNNLSEIELYNIFRKFGEERYSYRIARRIVEERRREPVSTTSHLVKIIFASIPAKSRHSRIHPATRIFQALRIAVNRELESLESALLKAVDYLNKNGRIAVISFHSLEDRIVKHTFRNLAHQGVLRLMTKKPLTPETSEKEENPPSRSAKLRVAERI